MKQSKICNYRLDPNKKILSGIAVNTSGEVGIEERECIKEKARRRSGDIQVVSVFNGHTEIFIVFEYYGQAKGFKLLRYYFRKFVAAVTRNMNLGDILINVIIKGNEFSGFPVHGAGKTL